MGFDTDINVWGRKPCPKERPVTKPTTSIPTTVGTTRASTTTVPSQKARSFSTTTTPTTKTRSASTTWTPTPSDYDYFDSSFDGSWCYENDRVSYDIKKNNGDVGPAYDFVLDLEVRGSTNINDALLEALDIAKQVKKNGEISDKTQQMIIFLTDGQPSAGETFGPKIKENIKRENKDANIPIYGLAFGDGADFDLIKDISDESNGFAERIYESGNSFEQLEDFYNKISDPKLRDVSFEYLVNGKRIIPDNLTTTKINQVFGSNEYSIAGTFPEEEEINEIQVIMKANDQNGLIKKFIAVKPCPKFLTKPIPENAPDFLIPQRCFPIIVPKPIWEQSPTEKFMERLWAYKRINYLTEDNQNCSKGIDDTVNSNIEKTTIVPEVNNKDKISNCDKEATRLALKYNFVTDLTSLVIEEDDEYINKSAIEIGKKHFPSYGSPIAYSNYGYASYAAPMAMAFPPVRSAPPRIASYSAHPVPRRPNPQQTNLFDLRAGPSAAESSLGSSNLSNLVGGIFSKIVGGFKRSGRPSPVSRPIKPPPPANRRPSLSQPLNSTNDISYSTTTQVPTTTVTLGFCKMTMYDQTYFRGQPIEISGDVYDFSDLSFDNEVSSLKIEGDCCWTLYTDSNFQGGFLNLDVGEYQSPTEIKDIFKKASSAKARC